jgi:hypothetical protein
MTKEDYLKEIEVVYDEERRCLIEEILRDVQQSIQIEPGNSLDILRFPEEWFLGVDDGVICADIHREEEVGDECPLRSFIIEGFRTKYVGKKPLTVAAIRVQIFTNVHFAHVPAYSFEYVIQNNSDIDELLFCQALHRYFCGKKMQMPMLLPLIRIKTRRPRYVGCLYQCQENWPFLMTERTYDSMADAYEAANHLLDRFKEMYLVEKGCLSKWLCCVKEVIDVEKKSKYSSRHLH